MNTETFKVYRTPEEIAAAEQRDEPLVYGKAEVVEKLSADIEELREGNRHQRRKAAVLARQIKRRK